MTPTIRPLVIVGAGGHGRVILDAARAAGWVISGFLDTIQEAGTYIKDIPVLGLPDRLGDQDFLRAHVVIVAIGNQAARRHLSNRVMEGGGTLAIVRHPSAIVSPHAATGVGSFLAAGVIVNTDAVIGLHCILNTGCTIDHDVRLADGVQVCPGANLAGAVVCGADAFIGTGAVILPGIVVGAGATVGAGSVVTRDVAPGVTVVGNPADMTDTLFRAM